MRGYYVWEGYSETGFGVVANTAVEAKKLGFYYQQEYWHVEFIKMRARWMRHANVEGLDKGVVEVVDGLRRGFYASIEYNDCPACGECGQIFIRNGIVGCAGCLSPVQKGAQPNE